MPWMGVVRLLYWHNTWFWGVDLSRQACLPAQMGCYLSQMLHCPRRITLLVDARVCLVPTSALSCFAYAILLFTVEFDCPSELVCQRCC